MQISARDFTRTVVENLLGKPCWYVCYNEIGSTFQLALGAKVPRPRMLRNRSLPLMYRRNEGTANFLVWCSWRLEFGRRVVASSRDGSARAARNLDSLLGKTIISVDVMRPAWDMCIVFDSGQRLMVFADHVSRRGTTQENWYLALEQGIFFAGTGRRFGLAVSNKVDLADVELPDST